MNVGDSHVLVLRLDYQGMYVCCIMRVLLQVFIDWCLFIHASSPLCLINGVFHICGMYVCMYLCMYGLDSSQSLPSPPFLDCHSGARREWYRTASFRCN